MEDMEAFQLADLLGLEYRVETDDAGGLSMYAYTLASWGTHQLTCPSLPSVSVEVNGPLNDDQNCSSVRMGVTASSFRSRSSRSFVVKGRCA